MSLTSDQPAFNGFTSGKPNPNFSSVMDIEPQEIQKLLQTNSPPFELIDVRGPDEYHGELGHIPKSKLIVLGTLPHHLSKFNQQVNYVFVCRSGGRSAQAAAFFKEQGFSNVFNMKGGMILWNTLGFPKEY